MEINCLNKSDFYFLLSQDSKVQYAKILDQLKMHNIIETIAYRKNFTKKTV